eukprot:1157180-Pelagomonas_calceolata.AAC.5
MEFMAMRAFCQTAKSGEEVARVFIQAHLLGGNSRNFKPPRSDAFDCSVQSLLPKNSRVPFTST